jgi:polar amino acid transport system ATP-binding protein
VTDALLELSNIHKWYGRQHVLRGISFEVDAGSVVCILGPSGSGKSTLLRCINHLDKVDEGEVRLRGELLGYEVQGRSLVEKRERELARERAKFGFVFQHFELFGHMTAIENVMYGPVKVLGLPKEQARARAEGLLESVGLAERQDARPAALSGGQQQRVAIARAIAMEPDMVLLDEPTSALDPELVNDVLLAIRRLAVEGRTMIVVTHEVAFARDVADQVVFMDGGVVIESGTPADVLVNPLHERTQQFLGHLRGR